MKYFISIIQYFKNNIFKLYILIIILVMIIKNTYLYKIHSIKSLNLNIFNYKNLINSNNEINNTQVFYKSFCIIKIFPLNKINDINKIKWKGEINNEITFNENLIYKVEIIKLKKEDKNSLINENNIFIKIIDLNSEKYIDININSIIFSNNNIGFISKFKDSFELNCLAITYDNELSLNYFLICPFDLDTNNNIYYKNQLNIVNKLSNEIIKLRSNINKEIYMLNNTTLGDNLQLNNKLNLDKYNFNFKSVIKKEKEPEYEIPFIKTMNTNNSLFDFSNNINKNSSERNRNVFNKFINNSKLVNNKNNLNTVSSDILNNNYKEIYTSNLNSINYNNNNIKLINLNNNTNNSKSYYIECVVREGYLNLVKTNSVKILVDMFQNNYLNEKINKTKVIPSKIVITISSFKIFISEFIININVKDIKAIMLNEFNNRCLNIILENSYKDRNYLMLTFCEIANMSCSNLDKVINNICIYDWITSIQYFKFECGETYLNSLYKNSKDSLLLKTNINSNYNNRNNDKYNNNYLRPISNEYSDNINKIYMYANNKNQVYSNKIYEENISNNNSNNNINNLNKRLDKFIDKATDLLEKISGKIELNNNKENIIIKSSISNNNKDLQNNYYNNNNSTYNNTTAITTIDKHQNITYSDPALKYRIDELIKAENKKISKWKEKLKQLNK